MLCNFRQQELILRCGWLCLNRNIHVLIISEQQQGSARGVLSDFEVKVNCMNTQTDMYCKYTSACSLQIYLWGNQLGMRTFLYLMDGQKRQPDVSTWQ